MIVLKTPFKSLPPELARRYRFTRYVREEINHVFAWADLVLSRAGAGTVSELCVLGKPAVYVPLVPTGGDEQTRNAQMCERIGAAKIIRQSELQCRETVVGTAAAVKRRRATSENERRRPHFSQTRRRANFGKAVLELGK